MLAPEEPQTGGRLVLDDGPQASAGDPVVDLQIDRGVDPFRDESSPCRYLAQRHRKAATRRARKWRTGKVILVGSAVQLGGPHQCWDGGKRIP